MKREREERRADIITEEHLVQGAQPFLSLSAKQAAFHSEWSKMQNLSLCNREMLSLLGSCDSHTPLLSHTPQSDIIT